MSKYRNPLTETEIEEAFLCMLDDGFTRKEIIEILDAAWKKKLEENEG